MKLPVLEGGSIEILTAGFWAIVVLLSLLLLTITLFLISTNQYLVAAILCSGLVSVGLSLVFAKSWRDNISSSFSQFEEDETFEVSTRDAADILNELVIKLIGVMIAWFLTILLIAYFIFR